ncbi:hypothetical protein [Streptomyces asiaticus]|uniref:hypothetical protein n=1 Tax=Streptomyces asiaticus TaxID=114695 RepID=UPI0033D93EBC
MHSELRRFGHKVSPATVRRGLRTAGLDPAPRRQPAHGEWATFPKPRLACAFHFGLRPDHERKSEGALWPGTMRLV